MEFRCENCGATLTTEVNKKTGNVEVFNCSACLTTEHEVGRDMGYSEGYDEGYPQGRLDFE